MDGWEISDALAAGALGCLLMYLGMRCIDWWLSRRTWRELERARDELIEFAARERVFGSPDSPDPHYGLSHRSFLAGRDPGDENDAG